MKKMRKVLATAATVLAVSLLAPTAAFAQGGTGGGIGGGSGGDTSQGDWHWRSSAYDESGKAWNEFLEKNGVSEKTALREVNSRVGETKVCEESKVVWWIADKRGKWTFNYTGRTDTRGGSDVWHPRKSYGRAPLQGEADAFRKWDREENGNKFKSKPGYTIICSGAFDVPDKTWTETTEKVVGKEVTTEDFNEQYSWYTQVTPGLLINGEDPIGENNLHPQKSKVTKTAYGELWDKVKNKKVKPNAEELTKLVKDAKAKDAKSSRQTVDLDAQNKAGMAEGGILNVTEQTRYAKMSVSTTVVTIRTTTCNFTQEWDYDKKKWKDATKECSDKDHKEESSTRSVTQGTLKNTGFWQLLSVHCNLDEFNALVNSSKDITVQDSGDPSKGVSAVAVTKKYDQTPAQLPFGQSTNSNAAQAATGDLGFFDKECPFNCRAEGDGATDKNGAADNVGAKGNKGNKYGAKADDGVNSNYYELFRDNETTTIKPDVWFPASSGVVDYDGHAPLSTTITRDADGTPELGKFVKITTDDGKKLFTAEDNAPVTQKNYSVDTFSTATATQLAGLVEGVTVKSSWASEDARPQIFNFKWEYAPTVSMKVPTAGLGFGAGSGKQTIGSSSTLKTAVEGKCVGQYGTGEGYDTSSIAKNSGTGTSNEVDGKILGEAGKDAAKDPTNLVVKFIRSASE